MSTVEERSEFKNNPYYKDHKLYGDFSPFYATIAVCTTFGVLIILLNVFCICCSKYRTYWLDRNTGNLWLVSLWSATPHKTPPLDLTELKYDPAEFQEPHNSHQDIERGPTQLHQSKPEVETVKTHYPRPYRHHRQEEYVELHKKESDI